MIRYCILALIIGTSASARGQDTTATGAPATGAPATGGPATGWVRLAAPAAGAVLVADGRPLGRADAAYPLPAGPATLALVEGGGRAWQPRRAEVEVEVAAGDTLVVPLALPVRYVVSTLPSGAEVAVEHADGRREVLGPAPLVVDRPAALSGPLVATRRGYADARAAPGDSAVNRVLLTLRPLTEEEGAALDWRPPRRARTWIDVALGGVALASAAVAVHYKFRADDIDDRYRDEGSPERGNPALRVEAQRFDRISVGALGVMQASLGVLAFRLVLR
jgi:hypothetical protein